MSKFIVFNTFAQAKDYAERQGYTNEYEGCRCCGWSEYYEADEKTKLVIRRVLTDYMGSVSVKCYVIGRFKKGRKG